MVFVTETCRPC